MPQIAAVIYVLLVLVLVTRGRFASKRVLYGLLFAAALVSVTLILDRLGFQPPVT